MMTDGKVRVGQLWRCHSDRYDYVVLVVSSSPRSPDEWSTDVACDIAQTFGIADWERTEKKVGHPIGHERWELISDVP